MERRDGPRQVVSSFGVALRHTGGAREAIDDAHRAADQAARDTHAATCRHGFSNPSSRSVWCAAPSIE
ncbi:unnamed protein product [Lampetra planeri]